MLPVMRPSPSAVGQNGEAKPACGVRAHPFSLLHNSGSGPAREVAKPFLGPSMMRPVTSYATRGVQLDLLLPAFGLR